jgi:glutaminyl-peptide cyclotransferase
MRALPIALVVCAIVIMACTSCDHDDQYPINEDNIPELDYILTRSYPHDTLSFTEGLLIFNDSLFESTGSPAALPWTRSVFGPVDPVTGRISARVELDKEQYFGEGIAYLDGKFYQLTYQSKIGFVYDASTYETTGQFSFLSDEGWGLTSDGASLIMSDGTDRLTYIEPDHFLVTRILYVTENGSPKSLLNELEYTGGFIYANVWQTSTVVKINAADGKVIGRIDLADFLTKVKNIYPGSLEMNGIACDPGSGHLFITGKCWPKIYEIALAE